MKHASLLAVLGLALSLGCASQAGGEPGKASRAEIVEAYASVELVLAKSLPPQFHLMLTQRAREVPPLTFNRLESKDGRLVAWLEEAPGEADRLMIALGVLEPGTYVIELRRSSDESLLQVIILEAS